MLFYLDITYQLINKVRKISRCCVLNYHTINKILVVWRKILGCAMFGLSIWMRFEPIFEEWVEYLNMYEFYIGIYLLIATSVLVMAIAFIGCAAALMEHILTLYAVRRLSIDLTSF